MKTEIEVLITRKTTEPHSSVRAEIIVTKELFTITGELANNFEIDKTYKITISEV